MFFRTYGEIRGDCGHVHRTLQGAQKCLARDIAGCKSQGGYSDRQIRIVFDNTYPLGRALGRALTEEEWDQYGP